MPPRKDPTETSQLEEKIEQISLRLDKFEEDKKESDKRLDGIEALLKGIVSTLEILKSNQEKPPSTPSTSTSPKFPTVQSPFTITANQNLPTTNQNLPPTSVLPTGKVPLNNRRRSLKVTEVKRHQDEDTEILERTIDVIDDTESETRGSVKLPPIPRLSCDKPGDATFWTQCIRRYMTLARIPEEKVVVWAGMTLPQKQSWWFSSWSTENPNATWDEFVEALLARYEPINFMDYTAIKYNELQQGSGSAQQFYDEMIELLSVLPPISEEAKTDKFIAGLKISTRQRVLEVHQSRGTRTFLAVAHTAIQYEETKKQLASIGGDARENNYNNHTDQKYYSKKFKKNFRDRSDSISEEPSTPPVIKTEGPGRTGQCHICGDTSHWARQCPRNSDNNRSTAQTTTSTTSSSSSSSSSPVPVTVAPSITVKKSNLLNYNGGKSRKFVLPAQVNDRDVSCILDAGSECSMVSSQLARELNISPQTVSPVTISGITGDVTTSTLVKLNLKFGSSAVPVSGYCIDKIPQDIILGLDWIQLLDSITWKKNSIGLKFCDGNTLEAVAVESYVVKENSLSSPSGQISLIQSETVGSSTSGTSSSTKTGETLTERKSDLVQSSLKHLGARNSLDSSSPSRSSYSNRKPRRRQHRFVASGTKQVKRGDM